MAKLGEIKIDEMGRGETWWEFKEDDIAGTGVSVDRFNVAAIIAAGDNLLCPVVGYIGKDKVLWKDRIAPKTRAIKEDETYVTEEELDEGAKKFKSYEEEIRKESQDKAEEAEEQPDTVDNENLRSGNTESQEVESESSDVKDQAEPDAREEAGNAPELLNMDNEDIEEVKGAPGGIEESISPELFRDGNTSKKKYSDMFQDVLGDFKEFKDASEELQGTKWWVIPHGDDIPVRENKYYPYYCAVYHLKMTYPYINYIKYFKKHGKYYFGIKYDRLNEVKYIMYGIEGKNIISEQPYMGMTGFVKWVPFKGSDRGMWVMYYNPYTGSIMIPKQKHD